MHPRVAAILIGGGGKPLQELEQATGKHFHFEGSEAIPLDSFAITAEGTRAEIEHRALPFKEGEEVLIEIEEPHMYNVDDAIAKIDGYVISISGGGPFVGERKLIRINEVKRTAAYASLVTENGGPERAAEPSARIEPPRDRGGGRSSTRRGGGRARGGARPRRAATIERLAGQTPPGPQRRPAAFAQGAGELSRLGEDMAYAIIEMGGKQYRVEKGDSVLVDRVDAKEGAKVSAPGAALRGGGDKTIIEGAELEKVKVEAVVAEHLKGEKIRVFKYRPEEALPQDPRSSLASDAASRSGTSAGSRKPAAAEVRTDGDGCCAKRPPRRR